MERKGAAAVREGSCILQTHDARLGTRAVTVEELVPQLEPQAREERMSAIERGLYEIFIQYESRTAEA